MPGHLKLKSLLPFQVESVFETIVEEKEEESTLTSRFILNLCLSMTSLLFYLMQFVLLTQSIITDLG